MREIDAEYYGYLDDGENLLIETEENCEKISKQAISFKLFNQKILFETQSNNLKLRVLKCHQLLEIK